MDTPDGPQASTRTPSSRPGSHKSGRSSRSRRSQTSSRTTEETPLLARENPSDNEEEDEAEHTPATTSLLRSLSGSEPGKTPYWKKRWPSILALVILCIVVVFIMLGFLATEGIEEYAQQAATFKPTKLALDSLTDNGVKVQVEGDFAMDASRVKKKTVRNFGRFGTWIAREVESGPTTVDVYLPEYGNVRLGSAKVPGVKVNIRNGKTTHVSIYTDVELGEVDGIRNIANDWFEGRLGQLRVKGKAEIPIKTGLIHLGKQVVEQSLVFEGHDVPSLPKYNIAKLNIREAKDGNKGMGADVSIEVANDFPIQITIPPVAVDVLVDGCLPSDKHIMVGTAESYELDVEPKTDILVNVTGHVEKLPNSLTEVCPNSAKSPLDSLLGNYIHGDEATVYLECCRFPDPSTPDWARDLLKDITLPVPVAGKEMSDLIKNFSIANVELDLPDPYAIPGTPQAAPKISGTVKVDINLPKEMNFPLDVKRVKANADVFYHNKKLGKLNLEKWQQANSTRIDAHGKEGPSLLVQSEIEKVPLEISDYKLAYEVLTAMSNGGVTLTVNAAVSVGVDTPMGKFAVREIPAKGVVPIKPIGNGDGNGDKGGLKMSGLNLKMGNLTIVDTTRSSIFLRALVNFTNPTNYSANVPYFNINILANGTVLGQAVVEDIFVHPGNNTNVPVHAVWDPLIHSGDDGKAVGRELLSQYVSGFNTTLTIQTHDASIPAQPDLGRAFSKFNFTFPTPRLSTPKEPSDDPDDPDEGEDNQGHFIRDATMHIISSTAIFTLASPFSSTTLYLTSLNATAFYEGHPSGKILYDLPFAIPPGVSESPRLPVDWSLGSVGYEAIKKALGGKLRLSTFAHVGIRIGHWREELWYKGRSIGANIRL